MDVELLIQAIVRQTTVLIARLATDGGQRVPLAGISDRVFVEMVLELERQGISRKVSADMFGLCLRTYVRKIRRKTELPSRREKSLWQQVFDFVTTRGAVTRCELLLEFPNESNSQVRAVLHDLWASGLLLAGGSGGGTYYRPGRSHALPNTNGAPEPRPPPDELRAALASLDATLSELRARVDGGDGAS
jgi:hypothetical protein